MSDSPVVVESPPSTTTGRPWRLGSKTPATAASAFRRRIDRLASSLISLSGMGIICAVLGIGVFLILETLPLFIGPRVQAALERQLSLEDTAFWLLVDEHQQVALALNKSPQLSLIPLTANGSITQIPVPDLGKERLSAVFASSNTSDIALATEQGKVWIGTIGLKTVFEATERFIRYDVEPMAVIEAAPGLRIDHIVWRAAGQGGLLVAVAEGFVIVTRLTIQRPLIGPARKTLDSFALSRPSSDEARITGLLMDEKATQLLLSTSSGMIERWHLGTNESERIETVAVASQGSIRAMAYLLGDRSVVVGGEDGSLSSWSLVRDETSSDGWRLKRIHSFRAHPTAVVTISPSSRDKCFITVSADGVSRLHYMTSERTLARWQAGALPLAADFAPKGNGFLMIGTDGVLRQWHIHNPHPEFSWRSLFGKIQYEGYEQPEYIWQSTGGTDDFEPKFSLIPLIFGTLKGTFYALLLAVPLALFGALYCSQFLEKRLRSPIKSTIELMAALPSVVLGFVAGVVLSSLVQRHIVSVLILPVVLPLVAVSGMFLAHSKMFPAAEAFIRRHEFWVLIFWVVVGLVMASCVGPWVERLFFKGDFEAWLLQFGGSRYDQRNALVVGWAIGFAVIPIIFTICEDAFSAVPSHLVGASLACGASAWQTAWRVVLPAAGSGVFSAIMIGFGRAVGETMIVLMATGNTPVMDWSIFNGFRALSANIAVEIPEAPYGGTLYRILFVSALILFSMTFIVNTVAELIRLRLRRQLQGL
ncbi:MAG: ABC transporter permease subunit [Candidatus Omnitrophica bacterium]|nr:ABC transporter permease subunit [Candidatus Omnitrophota bacterium]